MSQHDELPLFRPKLGGRTRKERVPSAASPLKRLTSPPRGGYVRRGHRPAHVKPVSHSSRQVVVKARVVRMNAYGRKAAQLHDRYLQRDHVSKDGSEGKFYGPEAGMTGDEMNPVLQDEPHQFRFIVSPADAHELDLTDFTRDLMQQMEQDLGRELHWKAVNHYNTDNPHSHVIVRGIDRQGKEVRIDPDYISKGLRYRAQELATRELGLEPEWQTGQMIVRDIGKHRYTSIDAGLSKMQDGQHIDLGSYPDHARQRLRHSHLAQRLQTLEELGLSEHRGAKVWKMQDGWQESLKEMGRRADVFSEMHEVLQGDPSRYRIYDSREHSEELEGKLVAKGLADEFGDRYYLILETPKGHAYYVQLQKGIDPEAYAAGQVISVRTEDDSWQKKADRIIADQAARNGGRYDKETHLQSISGETVPVGHGKVRKEEFVQALENRLHKLQRYHLARNQHDGSWTVSPDLLDTLKQRDQEQPLRKMTVTRETELSLEKQVRYRGRTWIDRFTADHDPSALAPYGFGKEMNSAVQRRTVMLREMGIDPFDSARAKALDELEKQDFAKSGAGKIGARYREVDPRGSLSGVVSDTGKFPSGKRYAQVFNAKSKEFSLVPWRKEYEQLVGKTVQMTRSSTGRYFMRQVERGIGR